MRNLIGTGVAAVLLLAPALGMLGCGADDNGTGPESGPASVAVTSAIDTILAVGRTAQLTATARDRNGDVVAAQFAWRSSNPAVVTVSATGVVTAQRAGTAGVIALATGSVSGSLRLRVLPADLPAVSALSGDAFGGGLVAALSVAKRPAVQAAWGQCGGGADTGNVASIVTCVAAVRAEVASAAETTDRALLAVLALFVDRIERLLGL